MVFHGSQGVSRRLDAAYSSLRYALLELARVGFLFADDVVDITAEHASGELGGRAGLLRRAAPV